MPDPRGAATPGRILNVNDDDATRYVITRLLERAGFTVLEAATGRQALYMAAELPDLVVLDVNLPDMSGFDVARRLRETPANAGVRILHVSAIRRDVEDRVTGLDGGADAYLTHPLNPAEVLATVKTLLRARSLEVAARSEADQWRTAFDSIVDAVALISKEGKVLQCNLAFAALHGKPLAQIVGESAKELASSTLGQLSINSHQASLSRKAQGVLEAEVDGQWFRVTEYPVFDSAGVATGSVQVFANIDDAKRAQAALAESEERFRLLVDGVKDYAIFMLDAKGRIVSWNEGAASITGYAAADVLGRPFTFFFNPEDLKRGAPQRELAAAEMNGQVRGEAWLTREDGRRYWAETLLTCVRDENDIIRGYANVIRDGTERKMLLEEVQHRAAALEESALRKDEFLAMLSHELRNPLAAMQTSLSVLNASSPVEAPVHKHQEAIGRQIKHLARMVDDLLDVSRITRGKIALRKEPLDAAKAVTRVVEAYRARLESRHHTLELELPAEPALFDADPIRFEQILSNLLTNADKYSDPGGKITVCIELEPRYVVMRVLDRGIGIPAEMLPRVFDLFSQSDVSLARSQGGLGIGLTIVKSLVEGHGGNIAAFSEGPGKGSELVVRFPRRTEAPAERVSSGDGVAATTSLAAPVNVRKRRILLVEDNVDINDAMASLLELWGYDVSVAFDGITGVARAASLRPDVMLVDIGLPGCSGYEVAERVRSADGSGETYMIAITGYGRPEDQQKALEAGFNLHLTKPVDEKELEKILNETARVRRPN